MDLKEILELAGAIRVKGHTRVTKGGKTVRVKSYYSTSTAPLSTHFVGMR